MMKALFCAVWLALSAGNLDAQHEFGIWSGISFATPTLIGKTKPVALYLAALRYSRTVVDGSRFDLQYTMDIVPFARIREESSAAAGAGAAPIGFAVRFRPGRRLQASAGISGGFLYFNRSIPLSGGARFNFSASLGLEARCAVGRSYAVEAGYKYHHLSNGYRAPSNPGFDSNLLFVGLTFKK